MEGFDPKTSFGHEASLRYDDEDTRGDEDETVAFLTRLAGRREALELAVGTGRIALPLTRAGVRVDGIEMSRHMVDRMREKGENRRSSDSRPVERMERRAVHRDQPAPRQRLRASDGMTPPRN